MLRFEALFGQIFRWRLNRSLKGLQPKSINVACCSWRPFLETEYESNWTTERKVAKAHSAVGGHFQTPIKLEADIIS